MEKIPGILFVAGILSCLYTVVMFGYVGRKVALWWIWPVAGIGFFAIAMMIQYLMKHHITIHFGVKAGIGTVFVVCGLIFVIVLGNILYYGQNSNEKEVSYLIILGAKVNGTKVSRALRYRLDEAINYMQEYPKTKAIVSGGQGKGEDITEAEAMFQYMVEQGIAPSRIMKEDASKNTRENIANSISLIEKNRENIMIVTNSFHVYRAVEIAKKQGIENPGSLSAPTDKILWLHYHVREVLAVIKYKLSGDI